MASLFGSVATEVGETVGDLALQKREERLTGEEHQRELQLQKMRMRHESGLTDKRIDADDRRQARRNEFETNLQGQRFEHEQSMFETETERRSTEAETAHGYEKEITSMQEQSDIIQTILSTELRNRNTRRMSGEGWNIDFEDRQGWDPTTGEITYTEIVNATAPSGRPYRIIGEYAFPAGEPNPQVYPFQSVEQQRQAEQVLYEGGVTVEQFRDDFGYIPSGYIFGKVTREDRQLRSVIEDTIGTLPAWMSSSSSRSKGSEISESDVVRKRMEEGPQAAGPQSDEPPYFTNPDGSTTTVDEMAAPLRARHDAQAAKLRQGALSEGQSLTQSGGGGGGGQDLDDAGAAEIARNISDAVSDAYMRGTASQR